jgi:MFS family permease
MGSAEVSIPRVYYGWVIVGVGCVAMWVGAFVATSPFSTFLTPMSDDLGWSKTTLNGAQAIGTVLAGLLAPLAGQLIDRYGTRLILTIAGLAMSVALFICASVQEPWQFVVGFSLGRVLFQGVIQIATPTAVANWFIRLRGRATGLALMGNAASVAVCVPLIQYVVDTTGWRAAWTLLAIMALVLLAPTAALFLRNRPEDLGLLPDGAAAPPPLSDASRQVGSGDSARERGPDPPWRLGLALRTRTFWCLLSAGGLSSLAVAGVTTHQMPLLLQNGLPPGVAASMVSAYAVFWTLGGVGWGFVAERVPVRFALAFVYVVGAAATLILLHADSPTPALVFAVLYGLTVGGGSTLEAVIWADYYGRTALGSIRGFARPFLMIANSIGPLSAGMAVDALGSYELPYTGFAAVACVAAILVLFAGTPRRAPRESDRLARPARGSPW